jgi:hypothetical protein
MRQTFAPLYQPGFGGTTALFRTRRLGSGPGGFSRLAVFVQRGSEPCGGGPHLARSGSAAPLPGGVHPARSRIIGIEALRKLSRATLAGATAGLIFVALLFAYVLDVTNNEEGDADVRGWLIVSVVASVLGAALLLRFFPATESDPDPGNKPRSSNRRQSPTFRRRARSASGARKLSFAGNRRRKQTCALCLPCRRVEGSNPFSRFKKGLHLQDLFVWQSSSASASPDDDWTIVSAATARTRSEGAR